MSTTSIRDARVLVTGGSGFIGWRLCARLAHEGAQVDATVRTTPLPPELDGRVASHGVDLADRSSVDSLLDRLRPDIVLHLASHVAGARDQALVLPTFEANLASSVYLLDAATRVGCRRFVQTGSLEEPAEDSSADAVPSSPYAVAKWAASAYGRMFHALYGAPVVLARLFMVYGPGQWDIRKLVPYTILALDRGDAPRFSSGTRAVDWVFVDDVVEGLIRLAAAPRIDGARVDLGSGTLTTVRTVIETIFELMAPDEEPDLGGRTDRPMEQVRVADLAASERLIGWCPETPLDAGLRLTIDWYRKMQADGRFEGDP